MLRRLLLVVPGAQSYEALRTVDNVVYPTFEAAVRARGMLDDDLDIYFAFTDVVMQTISDREIRRQFVLYLVNCRPSRPDQFLEHFRASLFPQGCDINDAWQELDLFATEFRTRLESHGLTPPANVQRASLPLLQIFDIQQCREAADALWAQLNIEQRAVAEAVLASIQDPRAAPRVTMIQAAGGCGKSFVCNYIAARVRSQGRAAVCVAASAQAAAVLTGGRTAHGQLRIPIDCDDSSYLSLSVREKDELSAAAVIIWDEASMVADTTADCVNRSLQDILGNKMAFGGMPVVFCGDFRQLLPVVRGGRGEFHTIQTCSWWKSVTVLRLYHNWRSQRPDWLQLLDDVGMGRVEKIAVDERATRQSLEDVVDYVWSDAASRPTAQRAVLTLTLEDAAVVNTAIINALPGATSIAHSYDYYMDCKEPDLYPEEFVRSLYISGVAPGQLELKVGARYIIMRNVDHRCGVVNGAQIMCTEVTRRHVIGAIPAAALLNIR